MIQVSDMNDRILAAFLAALLPGMSFAQGPHDYQCTYGDLQRRVVILYETGVTVPCEVHYYKNTEAPGEQQVLWRAMNETGYCERKTEEFVAKLQESGWNCSQYDVAAQDGESEQVAEPGQGDGSANDAESAEIDDTEALIPAEETEPTEE